MAIQFTEFFQALNPPIQTLSDSVTETYNVHVSIKREDLNHPEIVGNKLRKLKYNLIAAKNQDASSLLSFGGAYSNHILALSAAGRLFDIPTIGVIRGEELANTELNPVLQKARENGMHLHFILREQYKNKYDHSVERILRERFGQYYMVPEGGSNELGVKGAAEIVSDLDNRYDVITCACGTGGTLAGIIKGVFEHPSLACDVLGFSVLKGGDFLHHDIEQMITSDISSQVNWTISTDYHFGGYAKMKSPLLDFMKWFQETHNIDLDTIYTGKMVYGVYQLIESGYFTAGSHILMTHTGGTQTAKIEDRI